MTGFAFHKNLVFELAGVPARFHALPANGEVVIEFLTTGAMHVSTRTALLEQYANGQVKVNQPTGQASRGLVYSRPLADLSPDIRREVQRRVAYLEGNIRYSSPDLQRVMNRYGEGVEVRVVYDPEDMGEVLLWGPDDEEPISVLATDLEYAKGLTARQNAWIREQRRQQNKEGLNCVGLQEAKASITSTVEELMVSRSKRERRQSAVLKGGSSNRQVPATKSKTVSPKRKPSSPMQGRDASLGNSDVFEAVPILSPIVMSGPTRGGGHES
jgi:hypothetical protein